MKLEQRVALEVRAQGRRLAGYAATFGTEARILDFIEVIAPGAFSASLRSGRHIIAMVDHDASKVLARTKTGNLRLAEDSQGLEFEISVPDTTVGRDVLALVESRDVGGASFGFVIPEGGESWQGNKRPLTQIDLHEISIVSAWPAYSGTEVHARSRAPKLALANFYLETCR